MNAQGSPEPVGAPLAQADVEALIMPIIPANIKATMATQPVVAFQVNLAGVGAFEIRVAREATGMRAIFKRLPAGAPVARTRASCSCGRSCCIGRGCRRSCSGKGRYTIAQIRTDRNR